MNRRPLRRPAAATVGVLLTLGLLVGPTVAEEASPELRLHVTDVTAILGPETVPGTSETLTLRALVDNVGAGSVADLRLLVEIFAPVATRSEFHLAVDQGTPQGSLLADTVIDVAAGGPLPAGEIASVAVEVPRDRFTDGDGVHPVRISLTHGREVIDEANTAAVHLEEPPARPLSTMVAWPLWAPPAPPDGMADLADEVAPGGRLERLVWALEQHPRAPAQVLVAPHLLEDLADPAGSAVGADSLLDRLVQAVAELPPPIVSTYADADLTGLAAAGLQVEGLQHLLEAWRVGEETLGRAPLSHSLWETGTTSSIALREILGPARVERIVVPWSRLEEMDQPEATPPTIRILTPGGSGVESVVGDPWLEDRLRAIGSGPGPIGVQTLLAETAFVHLERPFATDRSLALIPPRLWSPSAEVADSLLGGLAAAPWLRLDGLDDLPTPRSPSSARLSPPAESTLGAGVWDGVADARTRLATVRDALAEPLDEVGGLSWSELDHHVLRASSATAGTATNHQRLEVVRTALEGVVGDLELPTEAQVTLTDVEGTLPVTVSRTSGPPVHVTIGLEAPPRLGFPQGATRSIVIGAGEQRTVTFDATAHAVGRTPVTIHAWLGPADSPIPISEGSLVVRSTALSGIALVALGAALALVLTWWLIRRRRTPSPPELRLVDREAA